ncbi:MAG TPA: glycosyltransferase, partial [Ohtaekwangia sp.]
NTFDWLLTETKKDHRVRMVHVNRLPPHVNGKKYAITLGIKAAKYEWLLFTDADCRPAGMDWIKSMSNGFSADSKFVLGYSPYLKGKGLLNHFIRFEALISGIQYLSFAVLGNPYMGVGRNLSYRRSLFLEAKGFNDTISITGGDDDLFVNRHANGGNTTVCIGGASLIYSIPQTTWSSFFTQKIRHLSVGKFYRFRHRALLGIFSVSWLVTWFAGFFLLCTTYGLYGVLGALLTRLLVFSLLVNKASEKLGQPFPVWAVLPLDFIYAFYYLVTGLVALVSKKVRWKN